MRECARSEAEEVLQTSPNAILPPPAVSLILLAFNQERYVGQAVEAALAQDYPNLEIVLSDHGSSDETWAIIKATAHRYHGPHRLILQQSVAKGGVLGHALDAVSRSTGALIVAAGGDDISRPDRVTTLAERWRRSGAAVLFSSAEIIDEDGRPAPPSAAGKGHVDHPGAFFPESRVPLVFGATAAYDRRALRAVEPPPFAVMAEDLFLTLILALRSARFEYVDVPLVQWRRHPDSLSSFDTGSPVSLGREARLRAHSSRVARILRYVEAAARTGTGVDQAYGSPAVIDLRRLRADAAFHQAWADWGSLSLGQRMAAILRVGTTAQRRSLLPRLLGDKLLGVLQRLR